MECEINTVFDETQSDISTFDHLHDHTVIDNQSKFIIKPNLDQGRPILLLKMFNVDDLENPEHLTKCVYCSSNDTLPEGNEYFSVDNS